MSGGKRKFELGDKVHLEFEVVKVKSTSSQGYHYVRLQRKGLGGGCNMLYSEDDLALCVVKHIREPRAPRVGDTFCHRESEAVCKIIGRYADKVWYAAMNGRTYDIKLHEFHEAWVFSS